MKKYDNYKNSGVEWLGEIPEHWEVLPSKRFHQVKKQSNSKRECDNVLSLTLRGVVNNDPDSPEGMVPKDYGTYQIFDKDDLVFKLIDLENVKTSRVGIVHEKGIMSSAYIRLIVGNENFPKYTFYYFYSLYINEVYNNLGSGVRSTLGPTDLLNIPYIKPSIEEQTAIAHFLDDKTTKIDQAIAIKQQQIELLKERRQILIHKAVTRGLDDTVKLKDSGVEWIGEIPEHWEVKKVKHFGTIKSGESVVNSLLSESGLYEVYGGNGNMGFYKKYNIEGEKIIIGRVGAYCGNVRFINDKKWISDNALILSLNNNELYNYISILLEIGNLNSLNSSNAQPLITGTKVLNFSIPIPPKQEQMEIAKYIETAKTKIATAISLKEQEIEKLKEYKMSLIDGVVSGKVKVS